MSKSGDRLQVGERVRVYQRGRKKTWTACFNWQGKHFRRSLRTTQKKIALGKAAKLDAQLSDGDYQQPVKPALTTPEPVITLREAKDRFIDLKKKVEARRNRTVVKYESTLTLFVDFCEERGAKLPPAVGLLLFDKFREKRMQEVSPSTVQNQSQIIKQFLAWCGERKLLDENPLAMQRFPKVRTPPRRRSFTAPGERGFKEIPWHAPGRYRGSGLHRRQGRGLQEFALRQR